MDTNLDIIRAKKLQHIAWMRARLAAGYRCVQASASGLRLRWSGGVPRDRRPLAPAAAKRQA
jgi:hypothetical protein